MTAKYDAELFSEDQIARAMAELPDYEQMEDAATLSTGTYDPAVVTAFAALAKALKGDVLMTGYNGMQVRRLRPEETRRASAVYRLQQAAERGEIEPALLTWGDDSKLPDGTRVEAKSGDKWLTGIIEASTDRQGEREYLVKLDNGRDALRKRGDLRKGEDR